MRDLSPRQARFVAEYLVDGNATQAALRAGYKAGPGIESTASHLLRTPKVVEALTAARSKLQVRTEITQEKVLAELALLAFSSVDHYDVDDEGNVKVKADAPTGAIRAVSSIKRKVFTDEHGNVTREVEIKLWDKPGPLKTAGKHVGLFNDREKSREEIEREVDRRIEQLVEQARAARLGRSIEAPAKVRP
ncbi:MAG TPA: terminase small subunit [Casimicrobiaceae bacterium]|jgi:phage terminase small subunit|nr:terminase small subunit [Casimicrobiaceae bacterium]